MPAVVVPSVRAVRWRRQMSDSTLACLSLVVDVVMVPLLVPSVCTVGWRRQLSASASRTLACVLTLGFSCDCQL